VRFEEFESLARREWQEIPDQFKGGVDALVVQRDAKTHPRKRDVYTLGECLTEAYPSDFGGPDNIRSALVLYYGSFRRLADDEPEFHWHQEIWETLTHELRHHLESLAAEDALDNLDAGMEENFRRVDGEHFDPFFYRLGERREDGWYQLEESFFREVDAEPGQAIAFDWEGRNYSVDVPGGDEDVTFVSIEGGVEDPPWELCLVLLRQRRLGARLRAALKGEWKVAQHSLAATPLP
jgi:hypothetical protein